MGKRGLRRALPKAETPGTSTSATLARLPQERPEPLLTPVDEPVPRPPSRKRHVESGRIKVVEAERRSDVREHCVSNVHRRLETRRRDMQTRTVDEDVVEVGNQATTWARVSNLGGGGPRLRGRVDVSVHGHTEGEKAKQERSPVVAALRPQASLSARRTLLLTRATTSKLPAWRQPPCLAGESFRMNDNRNT